jgi:hypothetical protein
VTDPAPVGSSHARQGKPWTAEEDRQLYDAFVAGQPIEFLASLHHRGEGGIKARLDRLGLIDEQGNAVQPPPAYAAPVRSRSRAASGRSTDEESGVAPIFTIRTDDGWIVELRSNEPLSKALAERLSAMLRRVLADDNAE